MSGGRGMRLLAVTTEMMRDETGADYLACPVAEAAVSAERAALQRLLGPETFSQYSTNLLTRNDGSYHLTVVSPPEWETLHADASPVSGLGFEVALTGLGRARRGEDETYYTVCEAAAVQELRASLGLPPRDLHVTLAFKQVDIHGVPKDRTTLLDPVP